VEGCRHDFAFDLSTKDDNYTQIAHDPVNQNLMTPFTLSAINITKREVVKTFNSLQFHFHHKSEHFLNGKEFDLELHVVH
jgi:carbonic anhydrase